MSQNKNRFIRVLWVLILVGLLYFALRNTPLVQIWNTLRKLQGWQIFALLGLNIVIYILIALRWWLIVHAEN